MLDRKFLMRAPIIIANWKMHKTLMEARHFIAELIQEVSTSKYQIGVAAPYTALDGCSKALSGTNILLGAQNIHEKSCGAYTGEISADMVKDAGAKFSIIGHSERRKYFSETNSIIQKKIETAIEKNIIPVLCIGETLQERGDTQKVLEKQLTECLGMLSIDQLKNLIIAYEPVWAIGTGKPASPQQANEAHSFIRSYCGERYSQEFANQIRIIYGGSVQPNNVQSLMLQPNIDGLLVGGASLEAASFIKIILTSE